MIPRSRPHFFSPLLEDLGMLVRMWRWCHGPLLGVMLWGCGGQQSIPDSATAAEPNRSESVGTQAVAAIAPAGDWSRFRGPDGSGQSATKGLPVTWSATENILWKTPLQGAGASSPIVQGDQIYLTSYTGYGVPGDAGGSLNNLKRQVLAFSLADGKPLWSKEIAAKLPEEEHVRDHGYAANTPVADAEQVYVFMGKTGVFAFDHSGKQLWQADVGSGTNGWGSAASPILHGNLVIVNASVESESLIALDKSTGKEVWRTPGINEAWNTPLLVTMSNGTSELVVATHGNIYGLEPATGKQLWKCATDITWYMVPSLVAHGDVVYALGGRSGNTGLAVRCGGRGDVTSSHRLWTTAKGTNVPSPIYHDGHLYLVNDSRAVAVCLNAETGDVVFEERLERAGQFYASLLLGDGKIYAVGREGRCFVWNAQPKFEQVAMNELRDGGVFNATLAVTENRLLLRSDKFLYCIGTK